MIKMMNYRIEFTKFIYSSVFISMVEIRVVLNFTRLTVVRDFKVIYDTK